MTDVQKFQKNHAQQGIMLRYMTLFQACYLHGPLVKRSTYRDQTEEEEQLSCFADLQTEHF